MFRVAHFTKCNPDVLWTRFIFKNHNNKMSHLCKHKCNKLIKLICNHMKCVLDSFTQTGAPALP